MYLIPRCIVIMPYVPYYMLMGSCSDPRRRNPLNGLFIKWCSKLYQGLLRSRAYSSKILFLESVSNETRKRISRTHLSNSINVYNKIHISRNRLLERLHIVCESKQHNAIEHISRTHSPKHIYRKFSTS